MKEAIAEPANNLKTKDMKVKNDDSELVLTKDFIAAVKNMMFETIIMMRVRKPEFRDCWVVGACEITDMASADGMSFHYGDTTCEYLKRDYNFFVEVDL